MTAGPRWPSSTAIERRFLDPPKAGAFRYAPTKPARLGTLLIGGFAAAGLLIALLVALAGLDPARDASPDDSLVVSPSVQASAPAAQPTQQGEERVGSPYLEDYVGAWLTWTPEGWRSFLSVWSDGMIRLSLTGPNGEAAGLEGTFSSTDGVISLFADDGYWGIAALIRLDDGDVRVALQPPSCPAGADACTVFLSPTDQQSYLGLSSSTPDDLRIFLRRNPDGNDIVRMLNDHVSNGWEGPADEALFTGLWWGLSDWCYAVSGFGEGRCYDLAAEFLQFESGLLPRGFDDSDWGEIPGAAGSIVDAGYALAAEWLVWDYPYPFRFTGRPGVDLRCVPTCEAALGS